MPKISVIIPVYNTEKYIEKCIKSVLKQTFKDIEIILINDGSTDSSGEICDSYANKDKRIKVIHINNGGVSKARNIGLENAVGEYLLFVDSDDWINNNMCEKMYKVATNNCADVVICSYKKYYNNTKKFESYLCKKNQNMSFEDHILDTNNNIRGYLWNKLIKKEVIKKMFNEDIVLEEDLMFLLDNIKNIRKFSIIEEELYNYRKQTTSITNTKKFNINRTSSLEVNKYVIENTNCKIKDIYKNIFVYKYCLYYTNFSKTDIKILVSKYKKIFKKYYKDILKSPMITKKNKIKKLLWVEGLKISRILKIKYKG